MHPSIRRHGTPADLIPLQFRLSRRGQRIQFGVNVRQHASLELALDGLFTNHRLVSQPHAVGRQHASQRVHKHAGHAQRIRDQASVLPPGASKTLQGVPCDVIPTRHRNFLDGVGHLLHGNVDEALGHLLGGPPGLGRQNGKLFTHYRIVQRLVCLRTEHLGEITRLHLADHHVGVCHRQRAAPAVTCRPGVGAGALGADAKSGAVKCQY